ncbi:reverse transcriptase, partial [Globisporangium splendens]
MEGIETPVGSMPGETVELTNEHFPHLSSHEWAALERMRAVIGDAAVISLLRSASPDEQRNAATSFMHHEIMNTHRQPATPATAMRVAPLKLDVSPYRGGENEPLARWFVELDAAITARQLRDPMQQVLFAMSNLAGRAKSWAGLLYYAVDEGDPARIVVPNDEGLRHRLLYECHDGPSSGHLGREKTFLNLSRDYYWPHMYKWVRKYVRTCEVCQRVKPSGSTRAPLRSLAVPSDSWKSVSMDFIFELPRDKHGRNGILVFVDRFSKMVHLTPVSDKISAEMTAKVFVDVVFRLHGLPSEIVSDRDTRFTSRFWRTLFGILDTKLSMSTAAHPETEVKLNE